MQTLPIWDLSDLAAGPDDPQLFLALDVVSHAANAFSTRYQQQLATLSPIELAVAIAEYESLHQRAAKPLSYASLRFAADTAVENGALMQRLREKTTTATLPLLFFSIELGAINSKRLEELTEQPELENYQHYLNAIKLSARYKLSEAEEKIIEEKANTGSRALARLFRELTSALRFELNNAKLTLSEISNLAFDPDQSVRTAAAEALSDGLKPQLRTLAFIYNNLLQDKATEDRLRGFESPEAARHLSNELSEKIVETVCQSAEASYPLVGRYYQAKRKLLHLETLYHFDRYAPIAPTAEPEISFDEAQRRVLQACENFDPEYAKIGREFFENAWIDAAPGPNKQGGAFCSYVAPDHHPFLFQSYLGKASDMNTLMHELGHGIHGALSRKQTLLNFHGTLPMAEVASTFAELLLFAEEEARAEPEQRLALYAQTIESTFATIQRQTAMYRFEQAVHQQRKNGEISVEQFGALWQEKMGAMFAGSVTLGESHEATWSFIPHLIGTPFYVYAYAFGKLLAMALFRKYQKGGASFARNYLQLLELGGSKTPAELVAPLGVDLSDPTFWAGALELLDGWIVTFETLAEQASVVP
jgi:oligoendopeptidase F